VVVQQPTVVQPAQTTVVVPQGNTVIYRQY